MLQHFIHVMNVLHLRMDGALRADFTAETAGDAEAFDDFDFHAGLLRPAQSTARLRRPGAEEKVENILDRLLVFRRERVSVDLVFTFHEVH